METKYIESFKVIGLKIRTTNKNMQGAKDIPALWKKFMSENTISEIPNKVDDTVFAIYTNYESDHTEAYDMILGCKVNSLGKIPKEMVGLDFKADKYAKFTSKGNLKNNIVYNKWTEIWNSNLDRKYVADFEVYGEKAINPDCAEVDIYISIK